MNVNLTASSCSSTDSNRQSLLSFESKLKLLLLIEDHPLLLLELSSLEG